jgi:hypothetical protein
MLTELIHHFVHVMTVIMKMSMNSVKNVHSNAQIVLIQLIVYLVLKTDKDYHPVNAQMVLMKSKVKLFAHLVNSLVLTV